MGGLPVLGIIGAGKLGTAIARLSLAAGHTVKVSALGLVEQTAIKMSLVAPGAVATEVGDLIATSDIVVLALPLRRFPDLPLEAMAGRVVVDAMNYWPPLDGVLPRYEDTSRPSSLLVQDALPPNANLVKTFNHLGYHQIEDQARPVDADDRIALAVSGDEPAAVAAVMSLVDRLGFDPVFAGGLDHSGALQPGSAIFGAQLAVSQMQELLAGSQRRDEAA